MDYKRLLEAYMQHVCDHEGTPFANPWEHKELMSLGLTRAEASEVIDLAAEACVKRRGGKV